MEIWLFRNGFGIEKAGTKISQLSVIHPKSFGRLFLFDKLRAQKLWHVVSRRPHLKHRRLSSSTASHALYKARCGVCARPQNIKRKNKFSHYLFKLKRGLIICLKKAAQRVHSQIYIYYICVCGAARLFFSAPKCTHTKAYTYIYQQGWFFKEAECMRLRFCGSARGARRHQFRK